MFFLQLLEIFLQTCCEQLNNAKVKAKRLHLNDSRESIEDSSSPITVPSYFFCTLLHFAFDNLYYVSSCGQ